MIIKVRTRGGNTCDMLVDNDFVPPYHLVPWFRNGYAYYHITKRVDGKETYLHIAAHRHVMGLQKGDQRVVDHINHNGLDNRRCNLRVCTMSQNMCNMKKLRRNTSGYKGVSLIKNPAYRFNPWIARANKEKKKYIIGYYPTKEAAAAAYDDFVSILHGEFALPNGVAL